MKKLFLIPLVLAVAFSSGIVAQEAVTLTTPVTATVAAEHVGYVGLDLDNARIVAQVENASNVVIATKIYDATTTPTGATLLHQLNSGTFSVNSLMKAVYTRLIADGVIPAGTVSGAPQ